jgi:outer membrane protein assembly factor BamB
MKYNLSNIMKRAWMLVKKSGLNISAALKKAWREAKEITMKGTEKQIAYATKLLENMNVHFNNLIAACPDNKKSVWVNLLDGINAIAAESYAGDIIDNLKIWFSDLPEDADVVCTPIIKNGVLIISYDDFSGYVVFDTDFKENFFTIQTDIFNDIDGVFTWSCLIQSQVPYTCKQNQVSCTITGFDDPMIFGIPCNLYGRL